MADLSNADSDTLRQAGSRDLTSLSNEGSSVANSIPIKQETADDLRRAEEILKTVTVNGRKKLLRRDNAIAFSEAGRILREVKGRLERGHYHAALQEFNISPETAKSAVRICTALDGQRDATHLLELGTSKLVELSLPKHEPSLRQLADGKSVHGQNLEALVKMSLQDFRLFIKKVMSATEGDHSIVAELVSDTAQDDKVLVDETAMPQEIEHHDVGEIIEQAKRIGNHLSEDARSAIQLGWIMIAAKRQVPPGHFCEFITKTLGISQCVASRMMKAAMLFPDIDRHPEICELGFSKLTELLWKDEAAVRSLVDGGTLAGYSLADFKAMTVREVRQALKDAAQEGKGEVSGEDDPGEQRKAYLVARVAMLVRFAEEAELNTLDDVLDELVGEISNSRFEPGLVAEDYVLTHRFLVSRGAQ